MKQPGLLGRAAGLVSLNVANIASRGDSCVSITRCHDAKWVLKGLADGNAAKGLVERTLQLISLSSEARSMGSWLRWRFGPEIQPPQSKQSSRTVSFCSFFVHLARKHVCTA